MCITTRIQKLQAKKAALDALIIKLEQFEQRSESLRAMLKDLVVAYETLAPEEVQEFAGEILTIISPVIAGENGIVVNTEYDSVFETEFCNPEDEATFSQEEAATMANLLQGSVEEVIRRRANEAFSDDRKSESEEQPNLLADEEPLTIESILTSKGFSQPQDLEYEDDGDKYETYRGWDIYFDLPNGGIVAIGLYNAEYNQPWDTSTEITQELDPTFPESLADYDDIVKWTRALIDQIENLEAPGQLALELKFPEPTDAEIQEELSLGADDEDAPETGEKTELQQVLVSNSNFTFEELGVSVSVESVFTEQEIESDGEDDDSDDPATQYVEEALFTVCDAEGQIQEYYSDVYSIFRAARYPLVASLENKAKYYANQFLQKLKKNAEIQEDEERTELQKLLKDTNHFVFQELQARVKIDSEFIENNHGEEPEMIEEALFTITDLNGEKIIHYYHSAEDLTAWKPIAGWNPLGNLMKTAEDYAKKWAKKASEPETEFEAMGYTVQVYPQLPMGVTFRFLNADKTVAFSNSLTAPEIGDRTWKVCAWDLIAAYREKEANRNKPDPSMVAANADPNEAFVELVKISSAVGYIKRKDNGELLAGYAAFSNRTPEGTKTVTMAKSRSSKWAEWLSGTFQIKCDSPRAPKRMISDNSKQPFAYEIKFKGLTMWQLEKLAQEDFSLLPGEMEEKQQNQELLRSELKTPTTPQKAASTEPASDGLDDTNGKTPPPPIEFAGLALSPECGLNEDEIELVEMAKSAIAECDSEAVKSVNGVFKEVCATSANRVKVWNALTENEQETYKLLLHMGFWETPDFSQQTPEYMVTIDGGLPATNVWISLRTIEGKPARVWRYKGQRDEIGYATKEAAVIAAIQQEAG